MHFLTRIIRILGAAPQLEIKLTKIAPGDFFRNSRVSYVLNQILMYVLCTVVLGNCCLHYSTSCILAVFQTVITRCARPSGRPYGRCLCATAPYFYEKNTIFKVPLTKYLWVFFNKVMH